MYDTIQEDLTCANDEKPKRILSCGALAMGIDFPIPSMVYAVRCWVSNELLPSCVLRQNDTSK